MCQSFQYAQTAICWIKLNNSNERVRELISASYDDIIMDIKNSIVIHIRHGDEFIVL